MKKTASKDDTQPAPKKREPGRPRYEKGSSADQTQIQLIQAAVSLFAQHGYDPVTTAAIAKKAGMTQSMVNYHFGSKSKIWEESIHHMMRERGKLFRTAASELAHLKPADRIKELLRQVIMANAQDPDYVRIATHEGTSPGPRLDWMIQNYYAQGYRVFDDAVRDAIDSGAIADLPVHDITNTITSAASFIFGLTALVENIYGHKVDDPDQVNSFCDSVTHILMHGLLTPKPDTAE